MKLTHEVLLIPQFVPNFRRPASSLTLMLTLVLLLCHISCTNGQHFPSPSANFSAPLCSSNSSSFTSLLPSSIFVVLGHCSDDQIDPWDNCITWDSLATYTFTSDEISQLQLLQMPQFTQGAGADSLGVQVTVQYDIPSLNANATFYEMVFAQITSPETGISSWTGFQPSVTPNTTAFTNWIQFYATEADTTGYSIVESFPLMVVGFNSSSGILQLNQSCSIDFQIAINCCGGSQPVVLNSQPYWILFLSTIAYFLASYVWAYSAIQLEQFAWWRRMIASIRHCGYTCCCCIFCKLWFRDEASAADDTPLLEDSQQLQEKNSIPTTTLPDQTVSPRTVNISDQLMRANALFLVLQFCFSVVNFVISVVKFVLLHDNYAAIEGGSQSSSVQRWGKYEAIYLFWTNSSVATLLASSLASHLVLKYQLYQTLQRNGQLLQVNSSGCCFRTFGSKWTHFRTFWALDLPRDRLICRRIVWGILFLMSPAILTHVLPMAIIFFPFVLAAFGVMTALTVLTYALIEWIERHRAAGSKTAVSSPFSSSASQDLESDSTPSATLESTVVESENQVEGSSKPVVSEQVEISGLSLLLVRLLCTIIVVLFVQTLLNYGILVYNSYTQGLINGPNDVWINPILIEWSQRSTSSYLQLIEADLYEKIKFITLFL